MDKIYDANMAKLKTTSNTTGNQIDGMEEEMIERLYMSELSWDLENKCFFKKPLKVGNSIYFTPSVEFDYFEKINDKKYSFNHIIHNVYEFEFRVTKMFPNNIHGNRFHYFVEVMLGFTLFHFNWTKEHGKDLETGKWYRGFGRVSGAGDPSKENPHIDRIAMKEIMKKGIIERILVVHNSRDYIEKMFSLFPDKVHTGESGLESLGYPEDFNRFKENLRGYSPEIKELQSTAQQDSYDLLNFLIRIE